MVLKKRTSLIGRLFTNKNTPAVAVTKKKSIIEEVLDSDSETKKPRLG